VQEECLNKPFFCFVSAINLFKKLLICGYAVKTERMLCGLLSQLLHQRIVNKMQSLKMGIYLLMIDFELSLKDTVLLTPIGSIGNSKVGII